jgi:uncharacterized protein YeaO (DUF488 family)
MAVRIVRLGTPRHPGEGLRIGTVRRPPRGVRKADYARLDYYDVWLPLLAPSADLLAWIHSHGADNDAAWKTFVGRYRAQMLNSTDRGQAIQFLARLATATPIAIGCHCADERRCHRSVLNQLIKEAAEAKP